MRTISMTTEYSRSYDFENLGVSTYKHPSPKPGSVTPDEAQELQIKFKGWFIQNVTHYCYVENHLLGHYKIYVYSKQFYILKK